MKLLFIGGPLDGNTKEIEDTRMYYEESVPKMERLQAPQERVSPTEGVICVGATKVKYLRRIIRVVDTAIAVFAIEGLTHGHILTHLIESYQGAASDFPSGQKTDLTHLDARCTLSGWQGWVGLKDMNQCQVRNSEGNTCDDQTIATWLWRGPQLHMCKSHHEEMMQHIAECSWCRENVEKKNVRRKKK